ncbi:hypothetical protein FHX77_000526 [Bifidobacterium commune]|uniref:hypothetical protein n=1 Tax=Bifidobacterium commune TaxID=1505727 RepID=UPI0013562CF3|nr:hypothetical protein [Bifidobacterium commune]MBB2955146.1 hypothetical protein [Bifidobacterium commune]
MMCHSQEWVGLHDKTVEVTATSADMLGEAGSNVPRFVEGSLSSLGPGAIAVNIEKMVPYGDYHLGQTVVFYGKNDYVYKAKIVAAVEIPKGLGSNATMDFFTLDGDFDLNGVIDDGFCSD